MWINLAELQIANTVTMRMRREAIFWSLFCLIVFFWLIWLETWNSPLYLRLYLYWYFVLFSGQSFDLFFASLFDRIWNQDFIKIYLHFVCILISLYFCRRNFLVPFMPHHWLDDLAWNLNFIHNFLLNWSLSFQLIWLN